MDLKGISWVGNFYQKFEAMCLEVEETMYEDTVKYVENQVQTVGSSMKRFYSDVTQDLLPPSSMEDAKAGDLNLPLDLYGDFGIYMKSKIGTKEKKPKTDCTKKVFENQVKTANQNPDYVPNVHSLSNKSNLRIRKSCKRENSTLKEQSGSVSRFDENPNRILPSNENCQQIQYSAQNVEGEKSDEVSKTENRSFKDFDRASPVNEICNSFHLESEITRTNFIEKIQTETEIGTEKIADIPSNGPSSDDISKEMDMRASSGCASLVEANAVSICTNDGAISRVESSSNWQTQSDEIDCGEDVLFSSGSSDGWNTKEVNEVDASFLSEMEIIQQPDKANLEESCIVVNRDDFHFAPRPEGKGKSYKKKTSHVFSPRKSSTRKQEYQQLALWPTVEDSKDSIRNLTFKDGKRFWNPDESEWEIL